ncbi:tRNA (adenosine(37)-N6)-threonylcarbamoyltransferase complex dimerization subunit type 1 TsaB [Cognatishimia activa]|uniref:tRNA (adenosine(37)-N6)-threonylcarbamoyltransferase complex dimerization subunit type 1 TsaB n=1 Tax=Cognatishimia activa TaxID=1715691 RepID=UPI0022320583|nr:tRNA (adenosine(37)-N6)-threonylcarbamoyltransferase complex dimerization subunit type 1 TsaB [Cognatishimia activa]UZD90131.1 tRNA (adenosine(37)-N6)-threonylcarbamoyltransferase complex dimerization subunit type 1 TsaB [Cognatishimia activa]
MASDPLILGFDTSAAHCAAALLCGDRLLGSVAQEMTRGQAEELMPILEALLKEHDLSWKDLNVIGVGIGPGNFTGIRISVSAARGLALALGIPTIGVSTFEASLHGISGPTVASVPAPRNQQYILEPQKEAVLHQGVFETTLPVVIPPAADELATNIAYVARERMHHETARPAPLYIRAADAAPSRDIPPQIL